MKAGRLRCLAHLFGISEKYPCKTLMFTKVGGTRRVGDILIRWLYQTEQNLRIAHIRNYKTRGAGNRPVEKHRWSLYKNNLVSVYECYYTFGGL
jgi:hypothetical protein